MLKKRLSCETCIHTTRKGCGLFKSSAEVWDKCLAGEYNIEIPFGWTKPMAYAYTYWEMTDVDILPDSLFEI